LESELKVERDHNKNLTTQIEQFKLQERLEIKNQTLLKSRIKELENTLNGSNSKVELEVRTLKDELKAKQRHLEVEQSKWTHDYNNLLSAKTSLEVEVKQVCKIVIRI
jgi:hypothetical protein